MVLGPLAGSGALRHQTYGFSKEIPSKSYRNPIENPMSLEGRNAKNFRKNENSKFLTSLFSGMECPQNGYKSIYIIIRDYFGVLPDRFCTFGLSL